MMRPQVFVGGHLVLKVPLTARQETVARLLSDGLSLDAIAKHLGCGRSAIDFHVVEACKRIPGDLPRSARLILWWRGAGLDVLEPPPGAPLRRVMAEATPAPRRAGPRSQ